MTFVSWFASLATVQFWVAIHYYIAYRYSGAEVFAEGVDRVFLMFAFACRHVSPTIYTRRQANKIPTSAHRTVMHLGVPNLTIPKSAWSACHVTDLDARHRRLAFPLEPRPRTVSSTPTNSSRFDALQ